MRWPLQRKTRELCLFGGLASISLGCAAPEPREGAWVAAGPALRSAPIPELNEDLQRVGQSEVSDSVRSVSVAAGPDYGALTPEVMGAIGSRDFQGDNLKRLEAFDLAFGAGFPRHLAGNLDFVPLVRLIGSRTVLVTDAQSTTSALFRSEFAGQLKYRIPLDREPVQTPSLAQVAFTKEVMLMAEAGYAVPLNTTSGESIRIAGSDLGSVTLEAPGPYATLRIGYAWGEVATGSCEAVCGPTPDRGQWICRPGVCTGKIYCDDRFGDCDKSARNGCETSLSTSANCGSCGRTCRFAPQAEMKCSDGACLVDACTNASFRNCDQIDYTGCETDVRMDARHCGQCFHRCPANHICTEARCIPRKQ
jgi:hypothetical protein